MPKIQPDALKACREAKNLTQEELARRTKVDVGTISRIERGSGQVRARTLQALSKCLDVATEVLTGDTPVPKPTLDEAFDSKSQLNIRIRDEARNALTLISARYDITPAAVIELAPFLFEWAATESLRRRRDGIERLEKLLDEAEQTRRATNDHLHHALSQSHQTEEILAAEKESIERRDIFGTWLALASSGSEDAGFSLIADYSEDDEGPFPAFLRALGIETGGSAEFDTWYSCGGPSYKVCKEEALVLAGGDEIIAASILAGVIPLHEMPKELRSSTDREARVEWLRKRLNQAKQEFAEQFPELAEGFAKLGDLQ